MAPDVDLELLARGTPGFSGADLENLVNEAALLDAMKSGKVFAAGVDVYEEEPAKGNVLVEYERTVATPHIGAGSAAASKRVGAEVARKINEFFE